MVSKNNKKCYSFWGSTSNSTMDAFTCGRSGSDQKYPYSRNSMFLD